MSNNAQAFPQFPKLPPELRLEIWAYCMPHRVVQMYDPKYAKSERRQRLARNCGTPMSTGPPLISRVCHESRIFALRHGSAETAALLEKPVWFNWTTDTVHIERTRLPLYFNNINWSTIKGRDHAATAPTVAPNRDVPLSVSWELIEQEFLRGDEKMTMWVVKHMAKRRKCEVVLFDMSIHMSHQDACASGLFGLFAEETTMHINIQDASQVETLSAAYDKAHAQMQRRNLRNISNLREYLAGGELGDDIKFFLRCVKTAWLKENKAVSRTFDPYRLVPKMEPGFKDLLEMLPQFVYVVAVHLCELDHVDSEKGKQKGEDNTN
ncbi:hypothetical protein F4779DRAFT_623417 [Xylariaceae sp. FL0662B]|nr:hypothetical protein F4779DRAFT_623417 [Xylariaceae sp. FL0662B]